MDINELNGAYVQGFVSKCAAAGIDAEELLVKLSAEDEPADAKKPSKGKEIAKATGKGALIGAGVGGVLNAAVAGTAGAALSKRDKIKNALKAALVGGAAGAVRGAPSGAMIGGISKAVA